MNRADESVDQPDGELEKITTYEEAFRQLSDGIPDFAIFRLDPSGNVATWNRGARDVKGYEASEIIGRHFSCFYPEEDIRQGKPQYLLEVAADRGSVKSEGWRLRQDGRKFWSSVLITCLKGPTGEVRGFAKVVWDLTQRKQAEDDLAFQAEVMRNMADGVVVLRSSDGIIVYTNPRFDEIFGYDRGELIGQFISVINAPGVRSQDEVAREIMFALEQEGTWSGDVHNIRKDGTTLWTRIMVSGFNHPEHGDVWVSVQTDITRQKELEDALIESEARYRSLVESANLAIVTSDQEGQIASWNRGAQDIFGYTREEVLGHSLTLLLPEQHRAAWHRSLARSAATGEGQILGSVQEFLGLGKDGSEFPIELSLFGWRGGDRWYLCAIIQDITEWKQAERDRIRLRELSLEERERRRLQAMIDAAPVGVMVVDAGTQRLVLVNREAQRLRGDSYQPGRLLSECGQDVIFRRPDGEKWDMPDLPLRRALHYGETVRAEEVIMEFPDQHMVPTLVNSTPVYAEDGRIVSAILMIQDTTPLQELENLRNEFLGIVTHELRTPLSAIKGAAATALRSRGSLRPRESQEFFQIIDQQADHLTDIANNLLDVTKIEASALELDVEPTDLTLVLEEAVANHRRANSHNLVVIRGPESLPQVNVDRHRINQVLVNLLNNAARFAPPESPIIVEADHPESYSVTVHVQHSGLAMPVERLPYLFQKFMRVDEDGGVNHRGLGIGLAICRGIVEAHGGRIWATNNDRTTGTTISFTLPKVVEEQIPSLDESLPRGIAARGNRAPNSGSRILAVDDDENALRFLRRLLEGAGYQTLTCIEPEEVPEIIEAQEPDLVLMDIMLPKVNGLDLMKSIRGYSDVPIMFLTARDARDDMITALRAGADDYLSKPYSEAELLARVEVILRRRSGIGLPGATPHFEFDGLIIDFDQRRVTVNGSEAWLTAMEFKLISALARHSGRVLTHDQILQLVWGRDYSGETELVRSMVRRVRRKLGEDTQNPHYIFTVARVGYRIASPHLLP